MKTILFLHLPQVSLYQESKLEKSSEDDFFFDPVVLVSAGYHLKTTDSSTIALKWLREGGIDLFCCMYKKEPPHEFLRSLADLDPFLLLLISSDQPPAAKHKMQNTAIRTSEYLGCPFSSSRLLGTIRQMFARQEQERWQIKEEKSLRSPVK